MTDTSIAQSEPVLVAIDISKARHAVLIAVSLPGCPAPALGIFLEQRLRRNTQRERDLQNRLQRGIAFAALDSPDVGAIKANCVSESLLRVALRLAKGAHPIAKVLY